MEKVAIKLLNKQVLPDGRKDKINFQGHGYYNERNGKHYLIYKEKNEGLKDVKTILRIDKSSQRILLKRSEPNEMKQVFDVDKNYDFQYNLGKYKLRFLIDTKYIEITSNKGNTIIVIEYILRHKGQVFTTNKLNIEYNFIKEEQQ